MPKHWLPLEANPEVLTSYAQRLGLGSHFSFCDVLGVEDWAIDMLPGKIHSVLLLYPISAASEEERLSTPTDPLANVYFMKQNIGNACGTIAILHSLLNLYQTSAIDFSPDSYVARMHSVTSSMDCTQRALWLEDDQEIESAHACTESLGQSSLPSDSEVDTHFVAFCTDNSGKLVYELDGRREGPLLRKTLQDNEAGIGAAVLEVIRDDFIARNPGDIRFSILALCEEE